MGTPLNFSGMLYSIVPYSVDRTTERIDMDEVEAIARRECPRMIIAGFSAYSRSLEWKRFREIADAVGAYLFADIAHIAGLVAGKQLENPVPYCDVVAATTHKTLRGPRGGMIMCRIAFASAIDRAVFPGVQGGPHDHVTAAKAVAYGEALAPEFADYAARVIANARTLADALAERGYRVVSGGTDNHMMLIDLFGSKGIPGQEGERALEAAGISVNKNMIPFDSRKPLDPSGIRLGTAALTTRGCEESDMGAVADLVDRALVQRHDDAALRGVRDHVKEFALKFPVPGIDR